MPETQPQPAPRFRFGIKRMLITVALIGCLLGLWRAFGHKEVEVRPANSTDAVAEDYFGFNPQTDLRVRNIAVVSGTFSKSTWLTSVLYLVQAGSVQQMNGFTVGRSPNRLGEMPWITMELTLALGEKNTPTGRFTALGCVGQTRGGGSGAGLTHNVRTVAHQMLPGKIVPGREYIIYVEGDTKAVVTGDMTMSDFVTKNPCNYLVVTAELN